MVFTYPTHAQIFKQSAHRASAVQPGPFLKAATGVAQVQEVWGGGDANFQQVSTIFYNFFIFPVYPLVN